MDFDSSNIAIDDVNITKQEQGSLSVSDKKYTVNHFDSHRQCSVISFVEFSQGHPNNVKLLWKAKDIRFEHPDGHLPSPNDLHSERLIGGAGNSRDSSSIILVPSRSENMLPFMIF